MMGLLNIPFVVLFGYAFSQVWERGKFPQAFGSGCLRASCVTGLPGMGKTSLIPAFFLKRRLFAIGSADRGWFDTPRRGFPDIPKC